MGDYMYIDTHCHLSVEDYDDIDSIIVENRKSGIDKIIISGCTKNSIIESIELANQYRDVYLTIGYHPSEAKIVTEDDILFLKKQILSTEKVVGIGEIGLDYHYGKEDADLQINLFRKQMDLARELHLPVVIHTRDATLDTINILKEYPDVIGDIHCFSGSVETANIYISMGYKLGIGGVVTFKNSNLFKVIESVDISNILFETDAPYLSPEPFRGKKNSSKNIPYISKKVSEILNLDEKSVAFKVLKNTYSLFDLK